MFWCRKYKVKIHGRAGLTYFEGPRNMEIDSEMRVGRSHLSIKVDSMRRWEPPHENEPVSFEDIERIRANISKVLSRLRIDWD
jgi:hypothetical protein